MVVKKKIDYSIKAKNKAGKTIASDNVTGYKNMRRERGTLKRTQLKKKWYRIEVKEEGTSKTTSKTAPQASSGKVTFSAKKNTEASNQRGYPVYSVYRSGEKKPVNGSLYRKLSSAKEAANNEQHAYNQHLKQTRIG
jgi:hypothetical protein